MIPWPGALFGAAIALVAVLGPTPASAGEPAAEVRAQDEAAWRDRISGARDALARVRAERKAVEEAVERMYRRRYPRGERRAALLAEREASRERYEESERALAATLEEARRAGVPPGWLRAPARIGPEASGEGDE